MKRNLLLTVALASLGTLAAGAAVNVHRMSAKELLANDKVSPLKKIEFVATRSADEPMTDFTATEAIAYYYGDLVGNGYAAYYVNLANMPLIDGEPTAPGQMLRVLIFTEMPAEGEEMTLPTGTFTFPAEPEDYDAYVPGTIMMDNTDLLDIFFNPDDPDDESLYAYSYMPVDGEVTITALENNTYEIKADFPEMWLMDENYEEILDQRSGSASFTGPCPVEDPLAYPALEEDTVLDVTGASGNYTEGDFSIAFYSVELDDEGFIVGPGQLMNVELFTEPTVPMNIENLPGEYTGVDVMTEGLVPGHFGKGLWYEMFENYYVAMCTQLTIYTELNGALRESAIGLADGGTITVSKSEKEGDYKFVFDLVTVEGKKITGSWEGPIAKYITDFTDDGSGVNTIKSNALNVRGGKGCITAPAGAEVSTLSGMRCGTDNLQPGLYLVKVGGKTAKVFVK